MKFFIKTTTWEEDNESPYPDAFKEQYIKVDCIRKEYYDNAYKGDDSEWKERGKNHRTNGEWMERDFDSMGWFVEINSLEELMKIIQITGQNIIISPQRWEAKDKTIPEIEIYNDFREQEEYEMTIEEQEK